MQRTAAASSRITKPNQRRSSSGLFGAAKRKKSVPSPRKKATPVDDELEKEEKKLDDIGVIASLAQDLRFSDVAQLLLYIRSHMFSAIPTSGAGMNSTRVAEVLNFRASLPPITSVAHVHAMTNTPTTTEREIALLINERVIRRAVVPQRATGGDALGEGLVLVDEWEQTVKAVEGLSEAAKERYCLCLRDPGQRPDFTPEEVTSLIHAGFLVRSSQNSAKADVFLRPGAATLGTLSGVTTSGSAFAAGSKNAAAGSSLEHLSGGSAATERLSSHGMQKLSQYVLCLPNTGPYLRLLSSAREHLLALLTKANKYRELPKDSLKERWDGGVAGPDEASKAARYRGEWKGVLPGRTKKWKQFYGLEFDWVLEECLGAGLVECFQTGSVGLGVRAL